MKGHTDNGAETQDFPPLDFDEQELMQLRKSGNDDSSLVVRRSIEKLREEKRLQQLIGDYDDLDDLDDD